MQEHLHVWNKCGDNILDRHMFLVFSNAVCFNASNNEETNTNNAPSLRKKKTQST